MMRSVTLLSLTMFALAVATGCSTKPKRPVLQHPQAVTVMTYNVENLFDTEDDPQIEDETYLPQERKSHPLIMAKCMELRQDWWKKECLEKDWNQKFLRRKMQRLADVILQVNQGRGPDVVVLPEVENQKVLDQLRVRFLQKANYKPAILVEGPDSRGIDVGILTRLPLVGAPTLHVVQFTEDADLGVKKEDIHPTRGILEATLKLPDGQLLTVLGIHFPSQGSPTGFRQQAIARLKEVKDKLPKDRMVIVGGDFNITISEDLSHKLYSSELSQEFGVSHLIGCSQCRGTHYYHRKRSWSFLDALLFSKDLLPKGSGPWKVEPSSIFVANDSLYQRNRWGSPARFGDGRRSTGVSDHWPLVATIVPRSPSVLMSKSKEKSNESN